MNNDIDFSTKSENTSPHFSLTVTSQPLQFETFDIDLLDTGCPLESIVGIGEISIVKVNVWDVERIDDCIVKIKCKVEDCVCICDFQAVHDTQAVIDIACNSGAKAVVVSNTCTNWKAALPIFVLPVNIVQKLASTSTLKGEFHIHGMDGDDTVMEDKKPKSFSSEQHFDGMEMKTTSKKRDFSTLTSTINASAGARCHNTMTCERDNSVIDTDFDDYSFEEKRSSLYYPRTDAHPLPIKEQESTENFDSDTESTFVSKRKRGNVSLRNKEFEILKNNEDDHLGSVDGVADQTDYRARTTSPNQSCVKVTCLEADETECNPFQHDFYSEIDISQGLSIKKHYGIVCVDPKRSVIDKKVINFWDSVRDRVCVFRLTEIEDIDKAQSIACLEGAKALFFLSRPSSVCEIPVFIISTQLTEKLWSLKTPVVFFDIHDSSGANSSETDTQFQGDTCERLPVESISNTDRKSSAIVDGIGKRMKTFFFGKERTLKEEKTNDLPSNRQAYIRIIHKIDSARISYALRELADDVMIYFNRNTPCIWGQIVAVAYLCNHFLTSENKHDLPSHVFKWICSEDLSDSVCLEFLKPGHPVGIDPPPHQVLFKFLLDRLEQSSVDCAKDLIYKDGWQWKTLALLEHCGLFRRKLDPEFWLKVEKCCCADVLIRHYEQLNQFIGRRRSHSLILAVQPSVDDMLLALLNFEEEKRVYLMSYLNRVIIFRIDDGLKRGESLSLLWNLCSAILSKATIGRNKDDYQEKIIRHILMRASFVEQNTFLTLSGIVEETRSQHASFFEDVQRIAMDVVREDFEQAGLNLEDLNEFLSLQLAADFVDSSVFLKALDRLVDKCMQQWPAFEDKLILLDLVYRKSLGDHITYRGSSLILSFKDHLQTALRKNSSSASSICKSLKLAASKPFLFVLPERKQVLADGAVSLIVSILAIKEIIRSPHCLVGIDNDQDNTGVLFNDLQKKIFALINRVKYTITEAANFCHKVFIMENVRENEMARQFGEALFTRCFSLWSPSVIADIKQEHKLVIDLLYSTGSQYVSAGDIACEFQSCKTYFDKMASNWISDFKTEKMTKLQLESLLKTSSDSVWESYEKYHKILFPTETQVKEKINQLSCLQRQISEYLTVTVDGFSLFLNEILAEYDCLPSTELKAIISDFGGSTSMKDTECKSLKEIRKSYEVLNSLIPLYADVFKGCAYFSKKYSALFRKTMKQAENRSHTLDTLKQSFEHTINWLRNVFRRDTSCYERVCKALEIIKLSSTSNSTDDLELELKSLLEFPITPLLKEQDAEIFKSVSFLHNLSEPLQGFILFCDKSMLLTSEKCSTYASLKEIVCNFYSQNPRDNDIASCLSFLKKLQSFFCPDTVSFDPWQDSRFAFDCTLPIINLLADFSRYPELWNYIESMGWMGDDGLKQFYLEYSNVTNVLLGDSSSYEMSVLDSMVPVVRAMSAVGGFGDCLRFAGFLAKMKGSEDVRLSLNPDFQDHIRQVFSRLSEISDWFSNGLDEAAVVRSLFIDAEETGFYFLSRGSHNDAKELVQTYLTLEFTVKKENELETKTYTASNLVQFIHQLSLSLHEKNSEKMQAFVEQYQILSRAFQNFLAIDSCGYENRSLSEFRCRAGHCFLEDARRLFQESENRLSKFSTWLRHTRDMYKASLFFWTEELRIINNLLHSICSGDVDSSLLLPKVSRLQMGPKKLKTMKPFLDRCIAHFQDQDQSLEKSWLVVVSQFIAELSDGLNSFKSDRSKKSTIIIHTIHCDNKEMITASLHVLQEIFMQRLPKCVEILDGSIPVSSDQMDVFLARIKAFPDLTFVICQAERLQSIVLEKLRFMLSTKDIGSEGINFHIIQHGESLISTSPWVDAKKWDSQDISFDAKREIGSGWRPLIMQEQFFRDIKVVWSPKCGSGKTHFIREELKALKIKFPDLQIHTLAIHEKTSCNSLIKSLNNNFDGSSKEKALYCSFSFLPQSDSSYENSWLSDINYFFFSLIVLHSVQSPDCSDVFCLTGYWTIFIELPEISTETAPAWLSRNIPIISCCCQYQNPTNHLIIDEKKRRVCTYLRAYENGTIDRKFERNAKKRLILALDCSGSMQGQPFQDACQNALSIFDSHVVEGDEFALILFDHNVYTPIPLQSITANINIVRQKLLNLQFYSGGTSMYRALRTAMTLASQQDGTMETWIISLTDGISDNKEFNEFRQDLVQSPQCLHMIIVGINLHPDYEQHVQILCNKYNRNVSDSKNKGFFVRADDSSTESIDAAFSVVKSRIPVSKTFELDGKLTDQDCHDYIRRFLPSFVDSDDKLLISFWMNFIYRRVKVFDRNDSFNYNVKHDQLGSSLMEVMLGEAERLLDVNYNRELLSRNYSQLIYDFTIPESPEFRLLCTAPEKMDPEEMKRLSELDLPGFRVPSKDELEDMSVLILSLSQAFGIPVETREDGTKFLSCIEENNFILTNDFGMKLLNIYERVACHVPCLLEGETGVSKTAITKMFSILRNTALKSRKEAETTADLEEIEKELCDEGFVLGSTSTSVAERLHDMVGKNRTAFASRLLQLIQSKAQNRSSAYVSIPPAIENSSDIKKEAIETLNFFGNSFLTESFFEINVDSSLTESYFISAFNKIQATAERMKDSGATIVVFLDEINTSSVLGLLKEIVIDHSIDGKMLADNIVVVGALNPPRSQIQMLTRERDLGRDWASGHYQVSALAPSMDKIKWSFHALTHSQEKDFIHRRIQSLQMEKMPLFLQISLTEIVSESHEIMRNFAYRNILSALKRYNGADLSDEELEQEATFRARSIVSLRDIQRVFRLFDFFIQDSGSHKIGERQACNTDNLRRAMLLAIAVVYYLRLDSSSRNDFLWMIDKLQTEQHEMIGLIDVLEAYMNEVIQATEIPSGIAITRGLKENIFATVVCTLSRTPLIIVGPPGSSKTLAVNTVGDNACGIDSLSAFYRKQPRLSLFHYQCSKKSTSREIAAVFEQAIQRQQRLDAEKQRCIVFMDEAGLPEDEKESLKVLHYLLEGHMSAEAQVGFVAISNHVLDAAKSNRCIMLLREEPDDEEMLNITNGVLFDFRQDGLCSAQDVDLEGSLLPVQEFSRRLCQSYNGLLKNSSPLPGLNTFFGLRDFIYFLKAVRYKSNLKSMRFHTSLSIIIHSIERNFNGVTSSQLRQLCAFFLKSLASVIDGIQVRKLESTFRQPLEVLKESLLPNVSNNGQQNRPRFKLIIDCSEDDSILRLLNISRLVEINQQSMFKLSQMPENMHLEQLRLVSGVKFAASQGNFVILSQTEPINESFYDLFNQRFRSITSKNGNQMLFANIAVGGISRRSQVRPEFECIVHVAESKMSETPAPFLNRFEKYRLTLGDILTSGWAHVRLMQTVIAQAQKRTREIATIFESSFSGFGWTQSEQTTQSIFINIMPPCSQSSLKPEEIFSGCEDKCITDMFIVLFHAVTSVGDNVVVPHIQSVLGIADTVFPYSLQGKFEDIVKSIFEETFIQEDHTGKDLEYILALMEMILTRYAVFRLIQLATPESIFANRNCLPDDIVKEYFRQEHFSLKLLLKKYSSHCQLLVIHTRSDQFIHSIPSISAEDSFSQDMNEEYEKLKRLVYDNPHTVVIEHLSRLRSEATLRRIVKAWVGHETKNQFLLLVDMSRENAFDQVNFVRTVVEQEVDKTSQKSFVLILHYSSSNLLRSKCYPALFLGGWQHVFLDGVGNGTAAVGVDRFIARACSSGELISENEEVWEHNAIESLFLRVLPFITNQSFTYKNQFSNWENFCDRRAFLDKLLLIRVGDKSIGEILCEKFQILWTKEILVKATQRASDALLCGTTKLSLTLSISSVFIQSFQAFFSSLLVEMNQWRNLDLVMAKSHSDEVSTLFGLVLKNLPLAPYDELILQRNQNNFRLYAHPATKTCVATVVFPFFFFVSNFLDELVEKVVENILRSKNTPLVDGFTAAHVSNELSSKECFRLTAEALRNGEISNNDEGRYNAVRYVINFVMEHSTYREDRNSLFNRYLQQYIEWKIGCTAHPFIFDWLHEQVGVLSSEENILAVHVVALIDPWISKVASLVECSELLPIFSKGNIQSFLSNRYKHTVSACLELLWNHNELSDGQKMAMVYATRFLRDILDEDESPKNMKSKRRQLRQLELLLTLHFAGTFSCPDLRKHFDWLFIEEREENDKDYALTHFLESAKSLRVELNQSLFEKTSLFLVGPLAPESDFAEDDICAILKAFLNEHASIQQKQLAVGLLRHTRKFAICDLKELPNKPFMSKINGDIECSGVAMFREDGTRCSIPHYIPYWLRPDAKVSDERQKQDMSSLDMSLQTFFSGYEHSFEGEVSRALFGVLLSAIDANSLTSEELFLLISKEIESESSVDRYTSTKLSRLRSLKSGANLCGSAVSALVLSACVLCFVAKIAQEIATEHRAIVMSGIYSRDAATFLEFLMQQDSSNWQEFFINTIIRIRGEGTLAAVLGAGGPLNNYSWCQRWIDALPASMEGTLRSLHNAEKALAAMEQEETRKVNEFRLCPHCGNLFGIAQLNCGSFVCGRDSHGSGNIHGCGRGFNITAAAPYAVNEERLRPLRERVDTEREKLSRCQESKELLNRAKALTVPVYLIHAVHESVNESSLPAASFVSNGTEHESDSARLIRILWEFSALAPHLKFLPDFIEFYIWIHETFRFLVTRDTASSTKIGELMQKERLEERFDSAKINHLLSLWHRVRDGLNSILQSENQKLRWECQEIVFPFPNFETASLASLVSDGPHPSDGNDYLFIVINETIEKYNNFVERISSFCTSDDSKSSEIDVILPSFIRRGYGGALMLSTATPFSKDELDFVVEVSWNPELKTFDHDKILRIIKERTSLEKKLFSIGNPLNTLRQQFSYRDDESYLSEKGKAEALITKVDCNYFANQQDAQLVGEIHDLLKDFDSMVVEQSIEGILIDHFHSINYNSLRELLEGCRNLLDLLISYGVSSFKTIGSCLEDVFDDKEMNMLQMVGFPNLSNAQNKLLLTLNSSQFIEFLTFLAYQLASEAYSFASLPLHMSDSLPTRIVQQLHTSLCRESNNSNELRKAIREIEEFDRDVLSFYESQIRDAAAKSNKSLRLYLSENNFCDSSDTVFAVLPSPVSLRHYVAYRQILQQIRLSFLYRLKADKTEHRSSEKKSEKYRILRKGFCWMWESGEESAEDRPLVGEGQKEDSEQKQWKLWFERALSDDQVINTDKDDAEKATDGTEMHVEYVEQELMFDALSTDVDAMDCDENEGKQKMKWTENPEFRGSNSPEDRSACILQHWWRCELEKRKADNLYFFDALDAPDDSSDSLPGGHGLTFPNDDSGKNRSAITLQSNSGKKRSAITLESNPNATKGIFPCSRAFLHDRHSEYQPLTISDQPVDASYGTVVDENVMRRWLDENLLPQRAADHLLSLGARCIEDVKMLVLEYPELLADLPPLDRAKLKKIANAL